jgi:hypothetical protein
VGASAAGAGGATRTAFHSSRSVGADGRLSSNVVFEVPQRPSRTTFAHDTVTIASSAKSREAASRHSVSLTLPEESSRKMIFFATFAPAVVSCTVWAPTSVTTAMMPKH